MSFWITQLRELLPYLAVLLPAVPSGLWAWYKWRKEGYPWRSILSVALIAGSVLIGWVLIYFAAADKKVQLTQAQKDLAIQTERAERVQLQLQDIAARDATIDQRLQVLTKVISNPELRKEAEALHTELQRGVAENLHTSATVSAVVGGAQMGVFRNYWHLFFWVVAVVLSLFFGAYAVRIFVSSEKGKEDWAWKFYQWWFNFVGSLAGWFVLFGLVKRLTSNYPDSLGRLTFLDLVIFLIALIGITGHLPYTMMGLIQSLGDLFTKALEKISKKGNTEDT